MEWKTLESKEIFKTPRSRFRVDKCQLPDGTIMPRYYVVEFPDWVNIVAVTKDEQVVLIRQYRHAIGEVTIEIPGGAVDPEDGDPQDAAVRELREESGYTSEKVIYLGAHAPNPAAQTNRMHTFLMLGCEKTADQQLDPYERIEVFTHPLEGIEDLVENGKMTHSIVLGSLFRALIYLRNR